MKEVKRLLSAAEWGLFYGFFTWILGTGVTNKIPGWGVWLIIFNRIFMAIVIYYGLRLKIPRWLTGLLVGIIFSLPLGWVADKFWTDFYTLNSMIGALGTGMISGVLIAHSLHRKKQEEEAESQDILTAN